ncbi:site-specific integrase [Sphingobium sp. D43FB]|uniref:tyrosine-type recombinase/integrase n=1 Tax=Sphingobium sp. D43FB TaxID=2017595 RepID=UPI000BB544B2|nr:site-specific integrase [Sphingobium sp. D43FB]PBN42050.1 integrase [Sphingobium sp. D43FB]|tara:strand:+ start:6584 stop:7675 length:1092 start_codon:yes stop_codon:yes gene_type:complete
MALYKRASTYYVKCTAPDGTTVRRSTGTSDRKKAQEYHDKLKAQLWDLARLKQKPKRTWDEAALRWLKEMTHKKSYRDDVSRIRWFTKHLRGKTMEQVSRDMIDAIITRHHARSSNRTKDLYVALIRAIFRKAQREWEWIDQIPAFKTYEKSGKVRVRCLTHDQARALMDKLPAHQREVVLFALSTGLRQGNILNLTWDRVDMNRAIATIEHGDTKNGAALGVPLNAIALGVLGRQQGKHDTHVFTYRGNPLRCANNRAWRAALKACGIENFRWHDLRHTWASWLRQNDVPTWVLQELGGWKSESMVRRYAHMSVKHLAPYADQLIFPDTSGKIEKPRESVIDTGHKNGHSQSRPRLYLVSNK